MSDLTVAYVLKAAAVLCLVLLLWHELLTRRENKRR